jgi:hypothetical protein
MFRLGAVGEESCRAIERLAADGQPDLRRFLHVPHRLAVHVRGADIEYVLLPVVGSPKKWIWSQQPLRYDDFDGRFVPIP